MSVEKSHVENHFRETEQLLRRVSQEDLAYQVLQQRE